MEKEQIFTGSSGNSKEMNYIELIRELKTDFTGDFYLDSNYLGISYANDSNIIGTFKGSIDDAYLVPFKEIADKGTYRPYYTDYLYSAGSKYAIFKINASYDRIVYIYPYLWNNDKVEYDYLWNLHRSGIWSKFNYAYGVFIDDSIYYLAEPYNVLTSYPKMVNSLSKWNEDTEVFTYTLDDTYNFDPYVRPKIKDTYQVYDRRLFTFTVYVSESDNGRKIRIQIAHSSDFSDISYNSTVTATHPSVIFGFLFSAGGTSYVRIRFEDADGGNPSDWSSTIACNVSNPTAYDFSEEYPGWSDTYGDLIEKWRVSFAFEITPKLYDYNSKK